MTEACKTLWQSVTVEARLQTRLLDKEGVRLQGRVKARNKNRKTLQNHLSVKNYKDLMIEPTKIREVSGTPHQTRGIVFIKLQTAELLYAAGM